MKNTDETERDQRKAAQSGGWLERLASGAGFGAAITLLVVLAGAVASLYPNAIRSIAAFPNDQVGSPAAWWFLGLVAVAMALVIVNQSSIYKRSGREQLVLSNTLASLSSQQTKFHESLADLDGAVKRLNTLPSQSFLPAFRDSYREAFDLTLGCLAQNADKTATEFAIRSVLGAIIETAKDFDGASQESVYGANIMLFRAREENSRIEDSLGLVKVTACHEEFQGALELIPALSTSSAIALSAGWDKDVKTRPIALPIPTKSKDYRDPKTGRDKSVVLPGAPTSFVKRSFDAYPTMQAFEAALHASALQDIWVGHIMSYFTSAEGNGQHIRSFASLPIERTPNGRATSRAVQEESGGLAARSPASAPPLAVLNLHSNQPGLLADNGGSLFAPLMGPFSSLLAILIVQWQAHPQAAEAGATAPQNSGEPQKG